MTISFRTHPIRTRSSLATTAPYHFVNPRLHPLKPKAFQGLKSRQHRAAEGGQYRGRPPLPVRDRDLTETVRAVCAGAQGLFALKKVQLEFRSAADCHTCAFHQPSIELLLYQLLSNALKFTPAGGAVTVELKFINRWVRLSVSDTGCGIQEDQIPFLFDRYLHDDAMAPQPHGLGLGLPICQHIAERHGGTMIAESRPGQGSRFTLSLPDRRCGTADVSDVKFDYNGGFNPLLLALADALPPQAFSQRHLD